MILLKQITGNTDYRITGNGDIEVTGVTYDSRKVKKGYVFVCLHGQHVNGEEFIQDSISRGASVIVNNKEVDIKTANSGIVTQVIVPDTRVALAELSAMFYDKPSEKVNLIGVTGTNGKTTITYLIEAIFNNADLPTAVLGTIEYRFGKESYPSEITTPQSSDLQYFFNKAVEKKFKMVVMEVSSHSLALDRVLQVEFDAAIFTNLTRDHLDFHKTFEDYFGAKLKLFKMLDNEGRKKRKKCAIINIDDNWGAKIPGNVKCKVLRYSLTDTNSDVYATEIKLDAAKSSFVINYGDKKIKVASSLIGKHNIYNILAAAACAINFGISSDLIKKGIENVKNVPGRLEKVDYGQQFTVVVDYAHTDDALKNVLTLLKEVTEGRIITVFGCGGERDRSKRPIMGSVATQMSDYVIVTSDNPRNENPEKIIFDIEVGIRRTGKENYEILIDREQAIIRALQMAKKGDIVLLAGKGHEDYQIIGNEKLPFNDKDVVKKFFKSH